MLDVGGIVRNFLFSASFMVSHGRFLRGRNLRAMPLLYMRAFYGLVRTTLHYRRNNFLPLLTILLVIGVFDVARFISIFIISLILIFYTLLYMLVRIQ